MTGLTGLAERMRFGRRTAWIAGFLSGGLGGLAGTQGGLRAAALFGFDLQKQSFVATATAIALLVDLARTPVYLATEWNRLAPFWPLIGLATGGVLVGTLVGEPVLKKIPESLFRKIVSGLVLALGVLMLLGPES